MQVDLSRYENPLPLRNKLGRALWGVVQAVLFRPSLRPCHGWRRFLLRLFGARVGQGALIYPGCRIWAPWNLDIGEYVWLGDDVDCYCVDKIVLGGHSVVSQYAFLCAATHDPTDPHMRLITAPIHIGAGAWVCAGAFVGPGRTIGEGAIVGARAVVTKDVPPWTIVGGNPARELKKRVLVAPPPETGTQ